MNTPTGSGTTLQISTDNAFVDIINDNEGDIYRTSQTFAKDDLPYGVTLYARVRHASLALGNSKWSEVISFQVAIPSNVIGVCLDNSDSTKRGTTNWIDAKGNKLTSFNYQNHPTYAGASIVIDDASRGDPVYLLKIPRFYIKTSASGPVGTFAANKKCWWISDVYLKGFRPHAAFKRNSAGVISDYMYVGQYLGHAATVGGKTCLGSNKNKTVKADTDTPTFRTYITNRNNSSAGVSGYRMYDIWDRGALMMLSLIAKNSFDSQSAWGTNSAGTQQPATGSTNARMVFKGTVSSPQVSFEDGWHCYWYNCDLITLADMTGVPTLKSPTDLTTVLSFGSAAASRYTLPHVSSGYLSAWIRDWLDCPITIGSDTHDLLEIFLPGVVTSDESLASSYGHYWYGDWSNGFPKVMYAGAHWVHGLQAGLGTLHSYNGAAFTDWCLGARVAKN